MIIRHHDFEELPCSPAGVDASPCRAACDPTRPRGTVTGERSGARRAVHDNDVDCAFAKIVKRHARQWWCRIKRCAPRSTTIYSWMSTLHALVVDDKLT